MMSPLLSYWLEAAARSHPSSPALESGDIVLDYAALWRQTEMVAERIRAAGLTPGDRIGIAATRSPSTIVTILAAVKAGVAYVPLDTAYPVERLRAMLQDSRVRAVLGEPGALAALQSAVGEFPVLDRPAPTSDRPYAAEADLTYVLFTSGSTGRPKGVAMGAAPLSHLISWHARHPRLGQAARTLQFAPLSFDVHFQEIFSTIACVGTLVLLPEERRRDPSLLHTALIERKIERIFVPYVALQMLADASRAVVPTTLRDVVSAGEQLQISPAIRSMFARIPSAELHNHYGPTESHVVTAYELKGDAANWPEIPPIGTALPHVRLALRDAETGQSVQGGSGELLIGGDTLAHGYLGRHELSGERFREDISGLGGRWYVTGDLVKCDESGVYTYLGRADLQLKVDGFRVEPGEVEIALMGHDAVKDAVVTAPDIPGAGRQLVAHLVLRNPQADVDDVGMMLRRYLRERLPEYMVPVRYIALDSLPLTPSGKIDRKGLPAVEVKASKPGEVSTEIVRALWQELLGVPHIGDHQNIFDLGARSLLVLRFVARLKDSGGASLAVADVYDRPTVAGMAGALRGQRRPSGAGSTRIQSSDGIAIVGMAARVPGAADVDAFWEGLLAGRESIRHFSPQELDPSIPDSVRSASNFVAARGVLERADCFDAAFFGISAREATMLDPQQRLFLEACWTALEHAAVDPTRSDARVGVYGGTANNSYAPLLRQEQPDLVRQYGEFATMLASEKDYVATRVANRLNLKGPAVSIHTACSTGLVAVAQAWHALASGQCDVALAGGSTVVVPQEGGYLHVEGGMESADGHCRPFDADASGTVFAGGVGVVVLKRLADAMADGDTVYAVIRGVGLNNDGGEKASFTAPSAAGQAAAIRMALEHARVGPRSIGYVEAHGTGTALGDPIEIAALTSAWREDTADSQFCWIGSVKSNHGHMIAAAGVIGLIKTALALRGEVIPATLHFRHPNPHIDFARTPFRVVAENTPWPRSTEPRRAAVSSFGVGGTNAHVIVEEAPPRRATETVRAETLVLPLSGRTAEATQQRARDLADHLGRHPDAALTDVAATLMRGRRNMEFRLAVVACDVPEAVAALRSGKPAVSALDHPRVVYIFPGQGSQHPGMARSLYAEVPAFRDALDRCLSTLPSSLAEMRAWLVDSDPADNTVAEKLAETRFAQVALFCMSYSLAAWLDSLGVKADAMIGHSIGEYVAACRAGVFSLQDAIAAVVARGEAMWQQPRGAMLAVRSDAEALAPLLPAGVEVAACNAPSLTVVAGATGSIDAFAGQLEAKGIGSTRLRVSHAFHSAAMDGALPKVAAALGAMPLHPPAAMVYSGVTGLPLKPADATDPQYWARQVRAPVQFSRAVQAELGAGDVVFVEIGPGQALSALIRQHRTNKGSVPRVVPLLGPAQDPGDPSRYALEGLGGLWSAGVDIAWPVPASAPRIALPTYPFRGQSYWFTRRPIAGSNIPANSVLPAQEAPVSAPAPVPEVNNTMDRLPQLEQELKRVFSNVSGLSADEMTRDARFVDQGLDSLSMTQVTLELERVFGVKLRFRRLLEDLDTLGKLAQFLNNELPAERFQARPDVVPASGTHVQATAAGTLGLPVGPATGNAGLLQQVIQQQMQLMTQQLALLSGIPGVASAPAGAPALPAPAPAAPAGIDAGATSPQTSVKALVDKPFGASARITLQAQEALTAGQRQWLDEFVARYNARTGKSKAFSQQYRKVMADPRVVTGFNPMWKDLVYPIVVDRSKGAYLWDLDNNKYIDLLSAFGANLLGYQPDELLDAMVQQLRAGIEVGPQHPLAAEVAELIVECTGMERVAFCNTGSEAVMGAMRIARTVTGRKTIAIFTNSYHGIFDEVIVRGTKQLRSLSAAPGILANAVENILVLDWASEDSLRVLRERGRELAAIMTEPIQNKYPTVQPREFIQALRDISNEAGCALIFDEVVTGFRIAPGGAQEFYGVRADIATFGKVIGGGLPFAAIGGSAKWMDALDGGSWKYGDDSYPEAGVTYFAGTFVRHPLALAAARASLLHLKRGGRALYRVLNERTQRLVDRLNEAFAARAAPVKAVHCASLWRLQWDDDQKFVSLFYYLARFHGLHLYEQFGHFVTEAIGDAEADRIFDVFIQSLDELISKGLITPRGVVSQPEGAQTGRPLRLESTGARLSPGQTERWLAAGFDNSSRRALNESFCITLGGKVDLDALRAALQEVLTRHEAFRVRFDLDSPRQTLAAPGPIAVAEIDLPGDPDTALDAFCVEASARDFPLDQAPLAAVSLLRLAQGRVVVHVVASHLVFDGWAASVFIAELGKAYRAHSTGLPSVLQPAESPLAFAELEYARMEGPKGLESLQYWKELLRNLPAPLALGDRTPPVPRPFSGDTLRTRFEGDLIDRLRARARRAGVTLFQLMLAAVTIMLARRSGQSEFLVCVPFASQSLTTHGPLLADGVLDLPLRLGVGANDSIDAVLGRVARQLMDGVEHPLATQGAIARALGIQGAGDRPALTGVYFNLNPRVDLSDFAPLAATMHEGRKRGLLGELFFNFYERNDALTLDLHYSTDFFSPQRAQMLVDHLYAVCAALADPEADPLRIPADPVAARPLASDATRATVAALARPDEPSHTSLEQQIAEAMADVLGVKSIGRDENFFEHGGHSLLAARLSARLSEIVGQRLGFRALFEAPTAAQLAERLVQVASREAVQGPLRIPPRADQGRAPLSLMQQRMWFLENVLPGRQSHLVPSAHRLRGELHLEAFEQALQMMVQRQSALRTVIQRTAEGAEQRVLDDVKVSLGPVEDLSALPEQERNLQLAARIEDLVEVPFDVEDGPMFRVRLFRMGAEDHVFYFAAHHLVWDGWSFDVMYEDLSKLYGACLAKSPSPLPPLKVTYGDFAEWQQSFMQGEELGRQLDHWKKLLTPLPDPLELPADRQRPPEMSDIGRAVQFSVPVELTDTLRELARKQGGTLFMALFAAYAAFLQRMSGRSDLVIGTPVRGREVPELEPIIGFFVNALPLRIQVDPAASFEDLLRTARGVATDAFAYPDVPFEHLVRVLKVPRDMSRSPIYQVFFSFQDIRDRPTQWGNLKHARHAYRQPGGSFDLNLWFVETMEGLVAGFTYNTDIYIEKTVQLITRRFEQLLHQVAANPRRSVAELDLLPDKEVAQMRQWNATSSNFDRSARVHSLLENQAARTPENKAISCGALVLNYRDLETKANRIAHALRARGAGRGKLVGLCVERGIDMVLAQIAVLKAGAAYVPLDPVYPEERLRYMAEDAGLSLMISEADSLGRTGWPRDGALLLDIDAALINSQPDTPLREDALAARPEDAAYVIYTSGSTGKPKGVVVPHRAVVNFLTSMQREPGLTEADRLLAVTTLSFDIAVLELLLPLTAGAQVVLATRDDAVDGVTLCGLLESRKITAMQATPATWRILLEAGWVGSPGFKALVGGEALQPDLAKQLLARCSELWNMYGPTETTVWSTCSRIDHVDNGISIGRPIANTTVRILDERGKECAIGVPGEILIGGEGVTLGYLNRPELTAARFVEDPQGGPGGKFYRTGDRGRWRHDGQLECLGRLDNQVKLRGFRIELGEIEATLASHPDVDRCVVTTHEHQPGDVRLVAYVVSRDQMPPVSGLREHLRRELPEYMLPQHFVHLDAIPLLPNGKVDRKALPLSEFTPEVAVSKVEAAQTEREQALVEIWRELLGVDQVGVNDNFFDLGGHSLLALRAVAAAERRLGNRVNPRRYVFETLGQLARLDSDKTPQATPKVAAKQGLFGRVLGTLRGASARGNE